MNTETPVLIDINSVKRYTGDRSTTTIYARMRRDGFPRPITVGMRAKRWVEAEVVQWVQTQLDAARNVGA